MKVFGDARVKGRVYYRFKDAGSGLNYGVHNNSLRNLRRALLERILQVKDSGELAPPFQPDARFVFDQMSEFRSKLVEVVPVLRPLTTDEFVGRYEGLRKRRYENAALNYERRGVLRRDSHLTSFVKMEKLNLTDKPDPVPRVIQPRAYEYNIGLGKYIAHAEKPLYKAISRVMGHRAIFKGLNALDSGRLMRSHWDSMGADVVAVGMDASRFDQHVSEAMLEWEHSVWPRMVPFDCRKELKRLLSWQRFNKGRGPCDDGYASWHRRGCRMSGDMNTSSGNCLVMCGLVYSCMKHLGITQYKLANNGDDCVLFISRRDLHLMNDLEQWFQRMGFKMELEPPVYRFEHIKFCQTQPVMVEGTPLMVRDPRVAIAKDSTCLCNIMNPKVREAWLYCMREGGLALTSGVPIWQSFYAGMGGKKGAFKQELDTFFQSGLHKLSIGMHKRVRDIAPETRESFHEAFGLTPEEQISLEGWYMKYRRGTRPEAFNSPYDAEPLTVLGPLSGNLLLRNPAPDCYISYEPKNNCWIKRRNFRATQQE